MNNQISAETLQPTLHGDMKVITTELLAQLYGAEANSIQQNFKRNMGRFVAGKHFFKLEGAELREFKNRLTDSQSVGKHARSLILWTERGAARHAKMLETDQAWEVFEKLEDFYFTRGEAAHPRRQEVPPKSSGEQKPRYFIRMVVVDRLHGRTETFQGDASTVKDIVDGTARLFGMHIKKLIHLPATV